jgi:hypothetical protein
MLPIIHTLNSEEPEIQQSIFGKDQNNLQPLISRMIHISECQDENPLISHKEKDLVKGHKTRVGLLLKLFKISITKLKF